jgi:NifU-like protein involved in Fe-S cluster formation
MQSLKRSLVDLRSRVRASPRSGSKGRPSRKRAGNNTDIVQELSLPPVKIHCSVLAEDAIKMALVDYEKNALLPV